ncbi:hypothetical protein [Micromonospora sp. AKA38]|uniref:hypothetical protein n=1 Tax=Micromonospora sp. AKA38 TaxID=2733861 RepID=UPI0022BE4CC4|nr:hypothetical protein [Micromonospora sp. AKA38]GHJ12984.1 hypothetical protein TPA0908_09790 [Micromonospora sp. AKA38]
MNQRLIAALSVVLAIVAGVLTNLVTAGITPPLVVALVAVALLWAGLTALQRPGSPPATAPTSETRGDNSPIVNADNNSGHITFHAPPRSDRPSGDNGDPT